MLIKIFTSSKKKKIALLILLSCYGTQEDRVSAISQAVKISESLKFSATQVIHWHDNSSKLNIDH